MYRMIPDPVGLAFQECYCHVDELLTQCNQALSQITKGDAGASSASYSVSGQGCQDSNLGKCRNQNQIRPQFEQQQTMHNYYKYGSLRQFHLLVCVVVSGLLLHLGALKVH